MNTRYTTGQSVLIHDIIVNEEVTARIETDREMRRFASLLGI